MTANEEPAERGSGAQGTAVPGNAKPERSKHRGLARPTARLSPQHLAALGIPHTGLLQVSGLIYLSIVIVNLLGLVLPISILQVYDRVIPNAADATLTAIVLILLITAFCEATLRISRLYIDTASAARFSHNITVDALNRILNAPAGKLWSEPPSKILERLEAVARLGNFFGGTARQITIDLPFSLVFLGTIALVGGWIVLVPIAIMLIFGAATMLYGQVLADTIATKDQQDSRNFDFINEVLGGIATIKGHATEGFMLRRFERLSRTSAKLTYDLIAASDRAQIMAGTLGNITIIAIVSVGAIMAIDGSMTVGTLVACSMLSGRAIQPALRVAGVWNEFQRTRVTLRDAAELFAFPTPREHAGSEVCSSPPSIRVSGMTHIPKADQKGFQDLSLEIEAGNIVCISGPDGAGKSTLLKLLAGLDEPQIGEVELAGMPASEFRHRYRNSVGYVSPETKTFHGSILENLTLFGAGCAQEDALAIAQLLGLEQEIYRFPKGYATLLGGSAVEAMPPGFIQRVLIARALAQKPRLLVLDDAQTFLDQQSDISLRECLHDLRRTTTILIVSNKPEYIAMSDQVVDIWSGHAKIRQKPVAPRHSGKRPA